MRLAAQAVTLLLLTYEGARAVRVVNVEAELCSKVGVGGCVVNTTVVLNCTTPDAVNGTSAVDANSTVPWPFPLDPAPLNVCLIAYNDTITITLGANITCLDATLCQLVLQLTSALLINNGSIAANTVRVNATTVMLEVGSSISASGLGLRYGPAPGSLGAGGNFGGTGGGVTCTGEDGGVGAGIVTPKAMRVTQCCTGEYFYAFANATVGSFAYPDSAWETGSWGSGGGGSRGGGRVWISAQTAALDGYVGAEGGRPTVAGSGAGSGGTILIEAGVIRPSSISTGGVVSVNGGLALASYGAGGGGRITLRYGALSLPIPSFTSYGGGVEGMQPPAVPTCGMGAAGTVFFSQLVPVLPTEIPVRYNTLRVSNAGQQALALTPLFIEYNTSAQNVDAVGVDAVILTGTSYVTAMVMVLRRLFSVSGAHVSVLKSLPLLVSGDRERTASAARAGSWSSDIAYPGDLVGADVSDEAQMPLWQRARAELRRARRSGCVPGGTLQLPAVPVAGLSMLGSFLMPLVDELNPPTPGVNETRANLTVSAGAVELTDSTLLAVGAPVWISAINVTLVANAVLEVDEYLVIIANHTCYADCCAGPLTGCDTGSSVARRDSLAVGRPRPGRRALGATELQYGTIALRAGTDVIFGGDARFNQNPVLLVSADVSITVNSALATVSATADAHCNFNFTRRESCRELEWNARLPAPPVTSYTSVLSSRTGIITLTANGKFTATEGAVCAQTVVVGGPASAAGQGCPHGMGIGAGTNSATGSGAGGSHTSRGGAAADGSPSGVGYDSATTPLYVGSGGGGTQGSSGAGGGYLLLEGVAELRIAERVTVTVAGETGYSEGGGAGGSLYARTFRLTGGGTLAVNGGSSQSNLQGGGGGGSGGLLKLQSATLAPGPMTTPAAAALSDACSRSWADVVGCVQAARSQGRGPQVLPDLLERLDRVSADLAAIRSDAAAQVREALRQIHVGSPVALVDAAFVWQDNLLGVMHSVAAVNASFGSLRAGARLCIVGNACTRLWAQLSAWHGSTTAPPWVGSGVGLGLGDIASEFTGTLFLAGGSGSPVDPRGGSGEDGILTSPLCSAGTERNLRAQCEPCGLGRWRNASYDAQLTCAQCSNAPHRATYDNPTATSATCSYVCESGTLYPSCDTSYESLIASFGGPLDFGLALGGFLLAVILALLGVCQFRALAARNFKKSEGVGIGRSAGGTVSGGAQPMASTGKGKRGGRYGAAGAGSSAAGRFGMYGGAAAGMGPSDGKDRFDVAVATLQGGQGALPTEDENWPARAAAMWALAFRASGVTTVDFLVPACCLQEADLPRHATRIYLGGANVFGSSWRLRWDASRRMKAHVRTGAYARLAEKVNELVQWPRWGWEEIAFLLLRILAAPLAESFLKARQRVRVVLLLQMLLGSDRRDSWLRGAKAALLSDCVRVGISGDYTLAYIDILTADRVGGLAPGASSAAPAPPSSFTLPLAILLAGEGSLSRPYHIDANDLLVRAVPSLPSLSRFIDADWTEFVAEFNARARLLTTGALLQTGGPVLDFLAAVRTDADLLGGLQVELVRFWPTAQSYVKGAEGAEARPTISVGDKSEQSKAASAPPAVVSSPSYVAMGLPHDGSAGSLRGPLLEEEVDEGGALLPPALRSPPKAARSLEGSPSSPHSPRAVVAWEHREREESDSEDEREGEGDPTSLSSPDSPPRKPAYPGPPSEEGEDGDGRRTALWSTTLSSLQEDVVSSAECRLGLSITLRPVQSSSGAGVWSPPITPMQRPLTSAAAPAPSYAPAASMRSYPSTLDAEVDDMDPASFQFGVGDDGVGGVSGGGPAGGVAGIPQPLAPVAAQATSRPSRQQARRLIVERAAETRRAVEDKGFTPDTSGGYQAAAAAPTALAGPSAGLVEGPLVLHHLVAWLGNGSFDTWIGDADAVLISTSERWNAVLTILADWALGRAPDIGGDDDVLRQRLPLNSPRLPMPGLVFAGAYQTKGAVRGFASLLASDRPLTSHVFSMFGASWNPPSAREENRWGAGGGAAAGAPRRSSRRGSKNKAGIRGEAGGSPVDPLRQESEFMQRVVTAEARRIRALARRLQSFAARRARRAQLRASRRVQTLARRSSRYGQLASASPYGLQMVEAERRSGSATSSSDEEERRYPAHAYLLAAGGRRQSASSDSSGGAERSRRDDEEAARSDKEEEEDEEEEDGGNESDDSLSTPAPASMLWSGGLTPFNVFRMRHDEFETRPVLTRFAFLTRRVMCRRASPVAAAYTWRASVLLTLHMALLLIDVALSIIMVAQLTCVEGSADVGGGPGTLLPEVPSSAALFVVGECSYFAVTLYLAVPPLAALLAPLAGLFAVAAQSATALRAYAAWNASSLLTSVVGLALVSLNLEALGPPVLFAPLGLIVLKLAAAQLLPSELTALECYRPVRGWRGLYEVRAGPYERAVRAQAALYGGSKSSSFGLTIGDDSTAWAGLGRYGKLRRGSNWAAD